MNKDFYTKLVDLYAGGELTEELNDEMEAAAMADRDLAADMMGLKTTVRALQTLDTPKFTEESFQRIILKMHKQGVEVEPQSPEPAHWQYRLPMQG